MLTLFSTPKAFCRHIGVIQRNAITSWTRLSPRPEILLVGNEEGTAEICGEMGLRHIPELAGNEFGAPLLRDLFERATQSSTHPVLCYANADIVLLGDFLRAVARVAESASKFLMVGRRWDVAMEQAWDFDAPEWEARLRDFVAQHGAQAPPPGNSDYFAFSRGLWETIPPLAVGRGSWDPWLIYEARRLGARVVDASTAAMVVHQKHDQSSYPHGLRRWRAELNRNREIVGDDAARFCLYDATHVLTASGLEPARGARYFIRRLDTLPLFHPAWGAPLRLPRLAIAGLREARRRWVLARSPLHHLGQLILSHLPKDGITSVLGLAGPGENGAGGLGLRLAHELVWAGLPVVVYDPEPSAMEQARRQLTGPVEWAASAEACAEQGDVIVVTTASEENRRIANSVLDRASPPGTLIDCCGLLSKQPPPKGARYHSWVKP